MPSPLFNPFKHLFGSSQEKLSVHSTQEADLPKIVEVVSKKSEENEEFQVDENQINSDVAHKDNPTSSICSEALHSTSDITIPTTETSDLAGSIALVVLDVGSVSIDDDHHRLQANDEKFESSVTPFIIETNSNAAEETHPKSEDSISLLETTLCDHGSNGEHEVVQEKEETLREERNFSPSPSSSSSSETSIIVQDAQISQSSRRSLLTNWIQRALFRSNEVAAEATTVVDEVRNAKEPDNAEGCVATAGVCEKDLNQEADPGHCIGDNLSDEQEVSQVQSKQF
jgi:hypothetical protein